MPELQLHGPPAVRLDDGRCVALSAREAALLAWLHVEGPAPRSRLAGLLWPDGPESRARTNLRQTLARLKRSAGDLLDESQGVLRLAGTVQVDRSADAPLLGPLEFDDAPALAEWLLARREAHRREQQRLQLAQGRAHLATGDLDAALAAADEVLARDAAVEEAHRLRMEAFHRRGDRAAAVAAWDDCKLALRAAFGIAPSQATRLLGATILGSEAAAPAPAAARALPAALRRPPQLVGRDAVRRDIAQSLALGHVVVVAGAGGIGKSRLMAEVAGPWAPALTVGARPGDARVPGALAARLIEAAQEAFAPSLDEATRRDLGGLRAPAHADAQAVRSSAEHRQRLAAPARLVRACIGHGLRLVVIDDLQFADAESVAALRIVLDEGLGDGAGGGARALIGCRPDDAGPEVQALLAALAADGRAARFDLAPLTRDDLRGLLDDLPADGLDRDALAAALHVQVGGHPAFVLESLKALWLDGLAGWQPGQPLPVPATLVESVRQRLGRLPGDALWLAQLASVAGTDFSLALAGAVLGRPPHRLAPLFAVLEAAQVIDGLAFAHDLMAEAVERSLAPSLRVDLHRQVADHLAASGGAPAAVAAHLQQAGDVPAAARWFQRAAQHARERWQMPEAAQAFERAAAAHQACGDGAAAAAAWRDAARCWSRADRHANAAAALDAADQRVGSTRDRLLTLAACIAQRINARQHAEAVRHAARFAADLPAARAHLSRVELAESARFVCAAVPFGLALDDALALCDAALQATPDDEARAHLLAAKGGALHWAAHLAQADAALAAGLASADADESLRISIGNRLARVRHSLGDLPAAIDTGEAALAMAERMGAGAGVVTELNHVLAMMQLGAGRPALAMDRLQSLQRHLDSAGLPPSDWLACDLAVACTAVGRHDEADAWLQRYPGPGRSGYALHDLMFHAAQARLQAARGLSPEAAAQSMATLMQREALPPGPTLQWRTVRLQWQPAPPAEVDALLAELRSRGMRSLLRCALGAAARLALAAGRRAEARAHVDAMLALVAHTDIWCEEPAQAWVTAQAVLSACGDVDAARQARAEGAAWVVRRAADWTQADERDAWLEAHPLHRALRGGDAPASPGVAAVRSE